MTTVCVNSNNNKIFPYLGISIFTHGLLWLFLMWVIPKLLIVTPLKIEQRPNPAIKWIKIPNQLKMEKSISKIKPKTVGEENGLANHIAPPIPNPNPSPRPSEKSLTKLEDLKIGKVSHEQKSEVNKAQNELNKLEDESVKSPDKSYWKPPKPKNPQAMQDVPKEVSKILQSGPGLQFQYKVPKGVKLDQLNQLELKFYGFHRRVFESYLNAFTKAYYEMKKEYPYMDMAKLPSDAMYSQVTFNKNGIKNKVKPLKESSTPYFHEFFLKALGHMQIPNPPSELLEDDKFIINIGLEFHNG